MLVGIGLVHITSGVVRLVLVGVVAVLVGTGVVSDISAGVVGARLIVHVRSVSGSTLDAEDADLRGRNSEESTSQLKKSTGRDCGQLSNNSLVTMVVHRMRVVNPRRGKRTDCPLGLTMKKFMMIH